MQEYDIFFNQLNQRFYKSIGSEFDTSRQFFWEGWGNLGLEKLKGRKIKVLDLACGNGRFSLFLEKLGLDFTYLGIDADEFLIEKGRQSAGQKENIVFKKLDVLKELKNLKEKDFDLIVSFGFLHHIPTQKLRVQFFTDISNLLKGGQNLDQTLDQTKSQAVLTSWNFLKNESLNKRIYAFPGEKYAGFTLLKNDFLLDWRRGEVNKNQFLRFCHVYEEREIKSLGLKNGLVIKKHFQADGKNKDNDYWVLEKK